MDFEDDDISDTIDEIFKNCQALHRSSYPTTSINFEDLDLTLRVKQFRHAVGRGHYSDVYKGRLDNSTLVGIKLLRLPSYNPGKESLYRTVLLRFFREFTHWHGLDHINIARLLGFTLVDGNIGFVSLWYHHGDLVQHLSEHPDASKEDLILDVAEGIQYIHTHPQPLLHGDLKGANILINEDGVACLGDFGISKQVRDLSRKTGFTTTSGAAGTVPWMAPELLDKPSLSFSSDIYSFGGVLIEICCPGKYPYHYLSQETQIMLAKLQRRLPDRACYPELDHQDALWDFVITCLAHDSQARPNITDVVRNLYRQFGLAPRAVVSNPRRPRLPSADECSVDAEILKMVLGQSFDDLPELSQDPDNDPMAIDNYNQSPTLATGEGSRRGGNIANRVTNTLMRLLRKLPPKKTVYTPLKLLPAVNSISVQRDQAIKLDAITRLCELFDPSHPFHLRIIIQQREAFAFGVILRSLLPSPQPKPPGPLIIQTAEPSLDKDALQLPLEYMSNHDNINLRILAASFAPVIVMNVVGAKNYVTGKEIGDMVYLVTGDTSESVEFWARVLLLDALREWMVYIYNHCPPHIARKPENAPVVILECIIRVANTTPNHHITLKLLSAVLCSTTVTLGARDVAYTHHPGGISDGLLGERFVRCLEEVQHNKNADGRPKIPGHYRTVLELPDVEQGLIEILRIVNKLLPLHPSMFKDHWDRVISQLIEFAYDSETEELVSTSLQTLLLGEHHHLAKADNAEHNNRLIKMCINGLSNPNPPLPDDYFLETLKIMENAVCVPGHINQACKVLLKEPKAMSALLVEGIKRDNDDIRLAITEILCATLDNPYADTAVSGRLMDLLVEAGLLKSLFGLVKLELFGPKPAPYVGPKFGPKLKEILKHIGWLARSSKSNSSLEDDSALGDLLTIVHHKKAYWEKSYAARAIVLLWDSAIRNSTEPERLKLTQRIIDSGFLSTLCSWFERGDVDGVLYKSYQELHDVWAPLLRAASELHPSAFTPPLGYLDGPLAVPAPPSPFGLVSAMNRYLRRYSSHNTPGQATVINLLHDYLDELEADIIMDDQNLHLSMLFPSDD